MSTRVVLDQSALRQLLQGEDGPVAADLARRAIQVEGAAKRLCPVDTGNLRSSITWEMARDADGLVAMVGSNVEYAAAVEFGSRHAPAQPFLRPALEAGR